MRSHCALPSLLWNCPSNCLRAPLVTPPSVTTHTPRAHLAGKGRTPANTCPGDFAVRRPQTNTHDNEGIGLPCSWRARAGSPLLWRDGPLRARVYTAARPDPRSRLQSPPTPTTGPALPPRSQPNPRPSSAASTRRNGRACLHGVRRGDGAPAEAVERVRARSNREFGTTGQLTCR